MMDQLPDQYRIHHKANEMVTVSIKDLFKMHQDVLLLFTQCIQKKYNLKDVTVDAGPLRKQFDEIINHFKTKQNV